MRKVEKKWTSVMLALIILLSSVVYMLPTVVRANNPTDEAELETTLAETVEATESKNVLERVAEATRAVIEETVAQTVKPSETQPTEAETGEPTVSESERESTAETTEVIESETTEQSETVMPSTAEPPVTEVETTETTNPEEGEEADEAQTVTELPPETEGSELEEDVEEDSEPEEEKVKITFDTRGGAPIEPIELIKGEPLGKLPVPTKSEHPFIGWFFEDDKEADAQSIIDEDTTLFAIWDRIPENPDHLSVFDDTPVYIPVNYNIYPATPFGVKRFMRANALQANDPPIIGTDHPTEPGEVMLFKDATPVEGMVNTWEVTLRIEAKDDPKTSDVVLVMDRSGSMADYGRMESAKDAAKAFVKELLPSDTTRIGVVSFAGQASTDQELTNDQDALNDAIDGLVANGGTFTQAGVRQAKALLDNSEADYKHIVVLSDGEPTYSYEIPNDTTRRAGYVPGRIWHPPAWGWSGYWEDTYFTGTDYDRDDYNETRTGSGNSMYEYIERYDGRSAYYHHGNSAIAEAGFAGTAGYNVYTIGLQTNAIGSGVLDDMKQGNGTFTEVTDTSQLQSVFEQIAGQINAAAKNSVVGDPMGGGFVIPAAYVNQITTDPEEPAATYEDGTISWNPGTLTKPIEEGSDIKYAELKYTIEINDDILSQTPNENGEYPTNGDAQITYTDSEGNKQTKPFPKPMVDPVLLVVEKVLIDSHGNTVTDDDRIFTIEIKGELTAPEVPEQYHQIFNLKTGEKRIMTNLRLEDTYTVTETAVTGGSEISDYETTINVYNLDQNSFEINQDSPDSPVSVTNKEKPLGKLTVNKVFEPINPVAQSLFRSFFSLFQATVPPFKFTLTHPDGTTETFELNAGESKTFENLPYGEYTVVETESGNFVATYSDTDDTNGTFVDGKVTLTITEKEDSVTVTNRPEPEDENVEVTGKKVWSGGPEDSHVAVTMLLKRNGEIMDPQPEYTVTPETGTATEFTYTWTGLQKYDDKGVPYVYTIDEETTPNHYHKEISEDGLTVTNIYDINIADRITASKIWKDGPRPRPTIYFELFRKIEGGEEEKAADIDGNEVEVKELADGTSSVEWLNLPEEDGAGNTYIYYVKEKLSIDGEPETPENYVLSGEGTLTLTNTYQAPKDSVKATKTWVNGPTPRPDVWFKLYRNIEGGIVEEVPDVEVKHLPDGTLEVIWDDIDQTDKNGNPYIFTVKEVDADGNDFTPENYTKSEVGLTVTNTYKPPLISPIEAFKAWMNGPAQKPVVGLRLHRHLEGEEPSADPLVDAVSGATTVRLTSGNTSAGWQNFPATDENGVKYVYYIREVSQDGEYNPGVPPTLVYGPPKNFEVSNDNYADEETDPAWTITNTYVIPKEGEAIATKVWENGPTPKPTVWFKLYRQIEGGELEEVPDAEIKELLDGTTVVTWDNLEETDINGNPYTFVVKEVDVEGNDFTPENYVKSAVDDLTIKNIYVSPKTEVVAEKVWENAPPAPYNLPTVEFVLQYSTDGTTWEDYHQIGQVDGTPEPQIEGSSGEFEPWIYTWTNVPLTDKDGNPYTYRLMEKEVPANYEVAYEGTFEEGYAVTNTWQTISVSGTKTWSDNENQDGKRPESLVVNIMNGDEIVKTITLDGTVDDNGEIGAWKYSFTDLPKYDENNELINYTIEEAGYSPYTPAEITQPTMTKDVNEYTVDLENSYEPETVAVEGSKTWFDNYDEKGKRPESITVTLVGTITVIDEATGEETEKEVFNEEKIVSDPWTWEWTDLNKYSEGKEITYTLTESPVEGYVTEVSERSKRAWTQTAYSKSMRPGP